MDWFLPFSRDMLTATTDTGWLVLNIKNRVAKSGPLQGQRHPFVYQLVIALQHQGWRWLETYIWSKPNAVPGRFGPRTKDSFEYVYAFAKGLKPHFNFDAIRVPYRTTVDEIKSDSSARFTSNLGRVLTNRLLNVTCRPQQVSWPKLPDGCSTTPIGKTMCDE